MGKGELLGKGWTAEIYAWGDDQVLKLYQSSFPRRAAEKEYEIARAVQRTGLAVPVVGDLIEVDGRPGILFERIEGPSLGDGLKTRPWTIPASARRLAELHAAMHQVASDELPSLHERLRLKIHGAQSLSEQAKSTALRALAALPEGDRVCHGDFHPFNVLLSVRGPIIIDWTDAARGNPLGDVARTLLLLNFGTGSAIGPARLVIRLMLALYRAAYLRRYRQLRPVTERNLAGWRLPVTAGRLSEKIPHPAQVQQLKMAVNTLIRQNGA